MQSYTHVANAPLCNPSPPIASMRVTLLVKLRGRTHIRGRRFSPGFLVPFTCGIAALVLPLLRSFLARSVRAVGLHGETECHEEQSSGSTPRRDMGSFSRMTGRRTCLSISRRSSVPVL